MPLRDAEHHHVVFNCRTVEVIERHVLRHRQARRVSKLRRFIEDDVAQVRRQRGRLLRVLVQVGQVVGEQGPLRVHVWVHRGARGSRGASRMARGQRHAGGGPLLEIFVARVGDEVRHVDEIIDPPLDVRDRGLVRRESPLVVDDELEGVLPPSEVVYVGEVVPRAVHGYLPGPAVEGARDVDPTAAVLPLEDRRHRVL
eukprot:CAMPEP_0194272082 /NCGR_PEP_ID=MMETSP0169-20130528/5731_1 /TAXON_ID=218684 /ORGANISM="Corethron pennatum, Strain L29A3" /LENGTH=198 /DNA_ID=CAMNT_0039014641 /DNA_START=256 /DNA_END=849 /DNA_ORIENTATION=-